MKYEDLVSLVLVQQERIVELEKTVNTLNEKLTTSQNVVRDRARERAEVKAFIAQLKKGGVLK